MYTSPEDARSDLFLAALVYLIGPQVLLLLLNAVGIGRIAGIGAPLRGFITVVTTVLVPYLLIRYRNEPMSAFGLQGAGRPLWGLLLGLPVVVAGLLAAVAAGGEPTAALPLLGASALDTGLRLLRAVCVALLAVYCTVKARDAFPASEATSIREGIDRIGRIIGLVAGGSALLLVLFTGADLVLVVALTAGVAATVVLAARLLAGPSATSRAVLLTPTLILALQATRLTLDGVSFVQGLWGGALLAAIGLVIGALLERGRRAVPVLILAVVLALASPLTI